MRLRIAVLATLLSVLVAAIAPSLSSAAPRHNRGLTIAVIPSRHIDSGDGVVIYGELKGSDASGQTVTLYHHIAGTPGYTVVGHRTTGPGGFYEFTREVGVVTTNRSWYVVGPDGSHSRTVYERVAALVTLADSLGPDAQATTEEPVVFTGSVLPAFHRFQKVELQVETATTNDWRTIKVGRTGDAGNFSITYRWRVPGDYNLRVVFPGDKRNTAGVSGDDVSVTVQQKQIDGFTIASSAPVIDYGSSSPATISGTLTQQGATPNAGVPVALMARLAGSKTWEGVQTQSTGTGGTYSFTVSPAQNTYYMVQVSLQPKRHTASLFEGVRRTVSAAPDTTSGMTGQTIDITGSTLPGTAGEIVYLQRLGKAGGWNTVASTTTYGTGAFKFAWTLGAPGTKTFRVRVLGDRDNIGAVSSTFTETISAPTSQNGLPIAS